MQTLVLILVGLNSISTALCVWLVFRMLQGKGPPRLAFKPRFRPIPHKGIFVPTRKVGINGSNTEVGYYRPKDSTDATPILVTHYIEQDDTNGLMMERDSYTTEDGAIYTGSDFRARFVPAPVAQEVRSLVKGRKLAPARSNDRLTG